MGLRRRELALSSAVNRSWIRGPVPGGVFSPPQLGSTLAAWYDASDSSTLFQDSALTTAAVADADPVGGWKDKSGFGRHVIQATGAARPTLKLAIQNGRPVIRADGVDDVLKASLSCTVKHLFVVAKYSAATFASFNGLFTSTGGADIIFIGDSGLTSWFAAAGTYWKDGVQRSSLGVAGGGPMNAFAAMSLSITAGYTVTPQFFQDRANAGRFWLGDAAECWASDTVPSDATIAAEFRYARGKWGTP